ncbi:MAG: DUF2490 domain-containing protein [Congregibacter sp.]
MQKPCGTASANPCSQIIFLAWLFIGWPPCGAQAAEESYGSWLIGSAGGAFGADSSLRWAVDTQLRHFDIGTGFHEYLIRPSIGLAVGPSTRIWLGYGRFRNKTRSSFNADENRLWQQIDWRSSEVLGGSLTLRARTEQRDVTFSSDRRQVLRLMVSYRHPLGDTSATHWYTSVEPFFDLNTTDWGGGRGISQNRVQLGVSTRLSAKTRVEAGFMHQFFWAERGEDRVNLIATLALRFAF